MKQHILILFFSLIIFCVSNSQNIKFEHYNDNDGLSHNSVRHIVQDKKGFLWFGTFSGLNRFDGYQFKTYLSSAPGKNKLYNDDITALELDEESNNFWIGTRKGLTLYKMDTNVFTTFLPEKNNPNSLPEEEIRSVHVDRFKRVWVGTKTKGIHIFIYGENRFEHVPIKDFDYVKEIYEDKNGNIWLGSYGNASVAKITLDVGGNVVKTKTYTLSIPYSNEKNPYVNFIYEDAKHDVFIGTREGLYKLDKTNDEFATLYIDNKDIRIALGNHFLSVAQAPDGKYWVGTLGGLLVCNALEDIKNGNYKWYYSVLSDNTSLIDNLVSALYFDASGVLWIGTEDGLDKYDPYENQFALNKDISRYIGNQAPRIRGFSKTYDDKVIVQTRNNGLFISDNENFVPLYDNKRDMASIYSDDGKIFYCGLWNGNVLVYNYLKNSSTEINIGFQNAPVFAFCRIDEASLMVGSFGDGAVILDTKTLQVQNTKFLPRVQINAIENDTNDHLWFATETGAVKYGIKSGNMETYHSLSDNENRLPRNDNVSDIMIDSHGKVWASTPNGLSFYDALNNHFKELTEPKELSGKWITDMLTDENGDLWLNINNNSVARLKANLKDINIYHVNSGNRLDVFSSSGFYNFNNSNIYLGGKNGIIYFSPHTMTKNKWSPMPVITEFKIQNEEVFPGMNINGQVPLLKDFNYTKEVTLSYANRNFSFQFSAPSFTNERLNKFQYMLEGFDENWITTNSNSRTVQYTNLYPDDYVFKVRSSNSDGNWSDTASYQIKILPPFWLTPSAFILLFILLATIFYFVRREIKSRIKLKQELLTEKVNREHDIKLNAEKLRFFTNISHELRTPLTLILGPAKQLIDESKTNATDYQKSRYNLIYQNASRLLNLVNQVLDFRKAESGELKLKVSKTDILSYSKNIFDSFKEMANNKKIRLNFISEEESIIGWIDNDKYDKILYNLLSNALKFTNKFGNIDVFIRLKDGAREFLIVEVSDDGIGIPLKSQEKIFTRFYQATNSKPNNTGTGIGLSLVKSLVELHKGSIKVESSPNKGSIFKVEIPIERHLYNDKEVFEYILKDESLKDVLVIDKPAKKIIQSTELKQKILVVEDNAELRRYLIDYLSDYYKVYDAENGEEGLRICRQIKPILCVADVMMPVMDGHEFCSELKKDEFISHIPVVLLTALSENEDKVKGYGLGADGYLVKPFDPSLLKTVIENIIKSRLELKSKFSGEVESEISLLTHSPIDEEFMEKVTNLINENLSELDLSTEFLCDKLAVSSSKLYRKIKELTDLAPNEFIRTIRLKKSAQLLKSKKYNVSEVTNLVGFNDPLYFSRCFKKQFGFPPSKLIN
ncbi:hybrid sensor histidine kinase/response regulator transcription factor [Confluentibacter citreus]|uniref:hybrid sensor histidine kinase/response regulator transcription factor n=1 Tax=Confluentibacter citreus TaxID=2007307 RepID=UPI000C28D705|nr:two-component regulator propeller domain-containing protein [Confluentibacter citreus]